MEITETVLSIDKQSYISIVGNHLMYTSQVVKGAFPVDTPRVSVSTMTHCGRLIYAHTPRSVFYMNM